MAQKFSCTWNLFCNFNCCCVASGSRFVTSIDAVWDSSRRPLGGHLEDTRRPLGEHLAVRTGVLIDLHLAAQAFSTCTSGSSRRLQVHPSWSQIHPQSVQVGPKSAQVGSQSVQVSPKSAQDEPKIRPRAPKLSPRRSKLSPRGTQEAPS